MSPIRLTHATALILRLSRRAEKKPPSSEAAYLRPTGSRR
jgi:hypothetical protein